MINKRFPIVMMLEPLHACNLTCTGCGRIREYESTITERVPLEECLAAVDECGAPMVSICGGEPMMYPQIGELVTGILERNRHILPVHQRHVHQEAPAANSRPTSVSTSTSTWTAWRRRTTSAWSAKAYSAKRSKASRPAKAAGFQVCTNTTVYKETDMSEIEELFEYLKQFNVDGHQIAPAYGYSAVNDREIFLTRDDIHEKFKDIERLAQEIRRARRRRCTWSFLKGERELPCTAWGNPTYNVKGWKGPCYLITDGHYKTFEELMTQTPWESYGQGNDPRCEHCMVHCGFEPSAALGINAGIADNLKMLAWTLR